MKKNTKTAAAAIETAPELPGVETAAAVATAPAAAPEKKAAKAKAPKKAKATAPAAFTPPAAPQQKPAATPGAVYEYKGSIDSWLLLLKVLPKKSDRTVLTYVWSDGETLTASDGKRLVNVRPPKCPPAGLYKAEKKQTLTATAANLPVPDWRAVLPVVTEESPRVFVDFAQSRPLYPELYKLMDAMRNAGGFAMLDPDLDAVIDSLGCFTAHLGAADKVLFIGAVGPADEAQTLTMFMAMKRNNPYQL